MVLSIFNGLDLGISIESTQVMWFAMQPGGLKTELRVNI